MKRAPLTLAIVLVPFIVWCAVEYASRSHDRQVKQLWRDEDALIRAKQVERERALQPIPRPIDFQKKHGERDA